MQFGKQGQLGYLTTSHEQPYLNSLEINLSNWSIVKSEVLSLSPFIRKMTVRALVIYVALMV